MERQCSRLEIWQLISNFEYWLKGKEIDMFFPEEKEMLRLFKEFLGMDED